MKKIIFLLLLLPVIGIAQNIEIKSIERVKIPQNKKFYHPKISQDGNFLLLTSENYKGLYIYNINQKDLHQVSDKNGAGYQVSYENSKVLYAEDDYIKGRKVSNLMVYDLNNKSSKILKESIRNLKTPKISNGVVIYQQGDKIENITLSQKNNIITPSTVSIEDKKIILMANGKRQVITPFTKEGYIWPSISPNQKMILGYSLEKGTFITDFKGKVLKELGHIEAPIWMGDEFVVGMETCDNGKNILYSAIVLVDLKTKKKQKISPEGVIAMYPSVTSEKNKISFNSINGYIYIANVK